MITEKPHRPYYQQTVDETLTNIQSSLDGLSSTEATARLEKYGENALPQNRVNPAGCAFWPISTMSLFTSFWRRRC